MYVIHPKIYAYFTRVYVRIHIFISYVFYRWLHICTYHIFSNLYSAWYQQAGTSFKFEFRLEPTSCN